MANDIQKFDANQFAVTSGHICTINHDTIEGKIEIAAAVNSGKSMKDLVGETLRVVNVVTTPGVRSRTGEACTNTYLVCEDGTTYCTQSQGIADSIKVIVAAFTDKEGNFISPISKGVGIRIDSEELSNGNTIKKAIPVFLN